MSAAEETLIEASYTEPYFINLPDSVNNGNLSLVGNGTNLGGLEPAAGPGAKPKNAALGDLEPAAGPGATAPAAGAATGNEDTSCANGYLDDEWRQTPDQRNCEVRRTPQQ